ncbi:MAG: DUF3040 domain-containing protein [Promicromonosporaceae bacterium]|nr:DUF3040 domain-containing protein [Promicromonosporaceae bacterium]
MPLSERELRMLEQMERELAKTDPKLANTLATKGPKPKRWAGFMARVEARWDRRREQAGY